MVNIDNTFSPNSILPSNHSVAGVTPTANKTVSASYSFLSVTTFVTFPLSSPVND